MSSMTNALVAIIFLRKREVGVYCQCIIAFIWVSHFHGVLDICSSVVCDCCFSWSYPLAFCESASLMSLLIYAFKL